MLLHEAERRAAKYYSQHDRGIWPFPCDDGNNRRKDQNQNQRAFELVQKQRECGGLASRFESVRSISLQSSLGIILAKALRRRPQFRQELLRGMAPVIGRCGPITLVLSGMQITRKELGPRHSRPPLKITKRSLMRIMLNPTALARNKRRETALAMPTWYQS